MKTFTRESINQAIEKIEKNPYLIKGRESKDYDLILANGKTYPPILVLSEANKILGGEQLVIHDFRNNTRVPFKILRDLGYNVVLKKSNKSFIKQIEFDYQQFIIACKASNLIIADELAIRFITALITKPFVILTGLSGSGKTKLALAFTKWITQEDLYKVSNTFFKGEVVNSSMVAYQVTATDTVAVTFTQSETGTKATLPYELINEWIDIIKKNGFNPETPNRTIRKAVETATKYSSQLNSFESHLKAAAFSLIAKQVNEIEIAELRSVCIIPVGADWTNREPLLGYPNALESGKYVKPESGVLQLIINAINNPEKPFFLILDEMNLSHVERYFADFLSAMESKESIFLHSGKTDYDEIPPSIILPDNLFIVGTVNIDETTYMFSPKVLDRANVLEFRVNEIEMKKFLSGDIIVDFDKLKGHGVSMAEDFLVKSKNASEPSPKDKEITNDLLTFFTELKQVGAEFGYRTASEIIRFVAVCNQLKVGWSNNQILDAAIMQKLLPKLHGSRKKWNLH